MKVWVVEVNERISGTNTVVRVFSSEEKALDWIDKDVLKLDASSRFKESYVLDDFEVDEE